ncbi:MAG: B12-binding domain-containing radical SAM protein [Synergistaceae bacterium]|jgi:radical SAM superfamily enzyme YgiQ (UPF0313 family)|nr:B12-binding domain-containing radical SAM protein [Synergistaceae bacterium]
MSNLGYHYIYRKLRELGVAVERFFSSPIPHRSVERDTLLERFPVILASVSYEGDIPQLSGWLASGRINPSRRERDQDGGVVVGAGGAMTYINPLALSGICDFIVLGDGLPVIGYIADILRTSTTRDELLGRLAEHPSILVPGVHMVGTGSVALDVSKRLDISEDYGFGLWVTERTVFGSTLLIELQRGCARSCCYCTLPRCFSPLRQRGVELIKGDIERAMSVCDFDQVGLVTPEAGDYKGLDDLLGFIERSGKCVSFASLRVDGLTEGTMSVLSSGGRHSITIAPESGDDSLRALCGKKFTNDLIVEKLKMARSHGITDVKLYFMIGLPGENDESVESITELCGRIRSETGQRLTAAASPFVPKPGTKWAGVPFAGEKELRRRHALLARAFNGMSGVTLQSASVREACLEYAMAWADRSASERFIGGVPRKGIADGVDRTAAIEELESLGLNRPCLV